MRGRVVVDRLRLLLTQGALDSAVVYLAQTEVISS